MRHKVHGRRLSRDTAHRKALRKNMMADLITFEKVVTTEAKAKMLRPSVEKLITTAKRGLEKGKSDPASEIHARRLVASRVANIRTEEDENGIYSDVNVVKKLFAEIAPRFANRQGGYTRIIKMPRRGGDNAEMAMIMLLGEDE